MPMDIEARTKWNAEKYTQVKVYIEPELAAAFKAACATAGISMASALSQAMNGFCGRNPGKKLKSTAPDYSARGKRRVAFQHIIKQLEAIKDAEEQYRDNIPENLQGGSAYESADQTVAAMEDGLTALSDAFQ